MYFWVFQKKRGVFSSFLRFLVFVKFSFCPKSELCSGTSFPKVSISSKLWKKMCGFSKVGSKNHQKSPKSAFFQPKRRIMPAKMSKKWEKTCFFRDFLFFVFLKIKKNSRFFHLKRLARHKNTSFSRFYFFTFFRASVYGGRKTAFLKKSKKNEWGFCGKFLKKHVKKALYCGTSKKKKTAKTLVIIFCKIGVDALNPGHFLLFSVFFPKVFLTSCWLFKIIL